MSAKTDKTIKNLAIKNTAFFIELRSYIITKIPFIFYFICFRDSLCNICNLLVSTTLDKPNYLVFDNKIKQRFLLEKYFKTCKKHKRFSMLLCSVSSFFCLLSFFWTSMGKNLKENFSTEAKGLYWQYQLFFYIYLIFTFLSNLHLHPKKREWDDNFENRSIKLEK